MSKVVEKQAPGKLPYEVLKGYEPSIGRSLVEWSLARYPSKKILFGNNSATISGLE